MPRLVEVPIDQCFGETFRDSLRVKEREIEEAGYIHVTHVRLLTGVKDCVHEPRLRLNVIVRRAVEGQSAGGGGPLIEEDALDSRVLRCPNIDLALQKELEGKRVEEKRGEVP